MSYPFDWNDLKAFLAVMRTGRLTVAAKSLRVEHSTLSRRINRLEQALDVKLFERMPTGYQPRVSRPEEFHPRPLAERCVNLSIHTAPIR